MSASLSCEERRSLDRLHTFEFVKSEIGFGESTPFVGASRGVGNDFPGKYPAKLLAFHAWDLFSASGLSRAQEGPHYCSNDQSRLKRYWRTFNTTSTFYAIVHKSHVKRCARLQNSVVAEMPAFGILP